MAEEGYEEVHEEADSDAEPPERKSGDPTPESVGDRG
jgi:hypothetical protein